MAFDRRVCSLYFIIAINHFSCYNSYSFFDFYFLKGIGGHRMVLKHYKKRWVALILFVAPSFLGCLGVSGGASSLNVREEATVQKSETSMMQKAILGSYAIQANFLNNLPTTILLNDDKLLNAGASLSDISYAKIGMALAVFRVKKPDVINYLASKISTDSTDYSGLRAFILLNLVKDVSKLSGMTDEALATLFFEYLLKKYIIVPWVDVASYLEVFYSEEYLVFSKDFDELEMLLAKDIVGDKSSPALIEQAKTDFANDLAYFITGKDRHSPHSAEKNLVYVDLKASRMKLPVIKESELLYRTMTIKSPIGKLMVQSFVFYNEVDDPIYAIPNRHKDKIGAFIGVGALPWVEIIEKSQVTFRPSSKVKVVPMSAIQAPLAVNTGFLRFGIEEFKTDYRHVNFDIKMILSNGDTYVRPDDESLVLDMTIAYLKESASNDGLLKVQSVEGSSDYATNVYGLAALYDSLVLPLPDYYISTRDTELPDRSGFLRFSLDVTVYSMPDFKMKKKFQCEKSYSLESVLRRFSKDFPSADLAYLFEAEQVF